MNDIDIEVSFDFEKYRFDFKNNSEKELDIIFKDSKNTLFRSWVGIDTKSFYIKINSIFKYKDVIIEIGVAGEKFINDRRKKIIDELDIETDFQEINPITFLFDVQCLSLKKTS